MTVSPSRSTRACDLVLGLKPPEAESFRPQGWVDTVPWAAFLRASRGTGPDADEIKGEVAAPSTVQHELKRMVEAVFRLYRFNCELVEGGVANLTRFNPRIAIE
jgi:hypothetical protein